MVLLQELGKDFKTLGVGWVWETLRSAGHGTKTNYNLVAGAVGLQVCDGAAKAHVVGSNPLSALALHPINAVCQPGAACL